MKCTCKRCDGTGQTVCPDCNGQGEEIISIEQLDIHPNMEHRAEFEELKKDAARVRRQCAELQLLNPARMQSYNDQMIGALNSINAQADKLAGKTLVQSQ